MPTPATPPVLDPADATGIRLGRAVLCYLAMTIVVITLAPFRFSTGAVNSVSFVWQTGDAVMNVVMFVPIGFIYQLARRSGARVGWRGALLLGFALSAMVECVQLTAPGRFPSVPDLITNITGAGLGAWLAAAALGRTDGARAVRAFAVELPLMGVVYLLVPLAWLLAIGSDGDARAWCVLLLAASAGWVVGAVFRSFERAPMDRILLATLAWSAVALVPDAIASPRRAMIATMVALGASAVRAMLPALFARARRGRDERRFEATTLRAVLPLIGAYLVLTSLMPLDAFGTAWSGVLPLFPAGQVLSNAVILAALERIGAFTLLGYAIAEYGGRERDEWRTILPTVLAVVGCASAALEIVRGWHAGYAASASMVVLCLAGGAVGSWLYLLQLAHVRALVRKQKTA